MSMDPNPSSDLHVQISTMADFSVRFSITLECPNQHSEVSPAAATTTSHMQLISTPSTTPSANYQTTSNSTYSWLKMKKIVKF